MKPDPRTGLFSEHDMRRAGNPLPAVVAAICIGWLVAGCSSTPSIGVVTPDVAIHPPAAIMVPPEKLEPAFWTDAKTAPNEDARPAASKAATAPKAPAATATTANPASTHPAPAPAAVAPVSTAPVPAAPTPLIPPAAPAGVAKETGKAPMPAGPPPQ